ncbi:MAG: hypothetical protein NUW01_09410 [Gemmatimonadaceae bacterium]|nr:hypothetical protein [Gemmatimonadaceae bacterium]
MSTRQQLIDQAVAHMERATWAPERWAEAIRDGYKGEPYRFPVTENYKAQQTLWQAVHTTDPAPTPQPTPPPPASSSALLTRVRGVLILAEDPWPALQSPGYYKLWITADPGYAEWYADGLFIHAAKEQGRWIEAWCDCKADVTTPGVGTSPQSAIAMAERHGLDAWSGEGEVDHAFERAYAAGARTMVVNLGALTDGQRARIASAEVCVTSELYRNKEPGKQPDWMHVNPGVGGNCGATYGSTDEGATPLTMHDYSDCYVAGRDSMYCGGKPTPDYPTMP